MLCSCGSSRFKKGQETSKPASLRLEFQSCAACGRVVDWELWNSKSNRLLAVGDAARVQFQSTVVPAEITAVSATVEEE